MTIPDEVREAMARAVRDVWGKNERERYERAGQYGQIARMGWAEEYIDAALSALQSAGYAVVPVEATEEMISAGACVWANHPGYRIGFRHPITGDFSPALGGPKPSEFYAAMLAASQEKK